MRPDKPFALERRTDCTDPAIHHVGRREDVAARLGLDQRLTHQDVDGLVIVDLIAD